MSACDDVAPPEFEPEQKQVSFNLQTALANLEKRRSYASEFRVTWEGSFNGEPTTRLNLEQVLKPDMQEIYAATRNEQLETAISSILSRLKIKNGSTIKAGATPGKKYQTRTWGI